MTYESLVSKLAVYPSLSLLFHILLCRHGVLFCPPSNAAFISKTYAVPWVRVLWNQIAAAPKTSITPPLDARSLDVSVADEDSAWRNFHCFNQEFLSQQLFTSSAVVCIEMEARSYVEMSTHLTGTIEEVAR